MLARVMRGEYLPLMRMDGVIDAHLPMDLGAFPAFASEELGLGEINIEFRMGTMPDHVVGERKGTAMRICSDAVGIFEKATGIRPNTIMLNYDRKMCAEGDVHRDGMLGTGRHWHLDGGSDIKLLWCSGQGTEYATEAVSPVPLRSFFGSHAALLPGRLYAIATGTFVHRSPVIHADGTERTFVRIGLQCIRTR